jgi:hypothetical protein
VDGRVDVAEVYDELAELVLGVLDLAGALGDESGENVRPGVRYRPLFADALE